MTVAGVEPESQIVVVGQRAYTGSQEFFEPGRSAPDEVFEVTDLTMKRVHAQRLEITSVGWERDAGGRPRALMITAHSSLPDLMCLGDAPVRLNNGAVADLVSLEPVDDGTRIVVRILPWTLPERPWPVGLRVTALGVTREAAVPAGLELPEVRYRRRLRRHAARGATDPLGRLVVLRG
ncbi:hypothetical protein G5C51_14360 [Streptomyces sp. A7024]|uniref:Uncharacterized protein n=1 Tax=Streptomyces coryli TaxID=1128680 RepID=A0A6G4TYM2_9ACTN|nr:hypothetical protein [Streptomyces coryli]NGN65075.1 hypothetical protein [Streptomyces coryli]